MMGKAGGLSLSFSACSTFERCARRFALQRLNDLLPVPQRFEVKLQARLAPFGTFVGKVSDETIAAALRFFRTQGKYPEDLEAIALRLAGEWWKFSQAWAEAVRSGEGCPISRVWQPLDLFHYREPVSPEEITGLKARLNQVLLSWQSSPWPERIAMCPPERWRGLREPGELPASLRLDDLVVWAAPDFALIEDEDVWILDFKATSPGTAAYLRASTQLRWYALLAHHSWGIPVERLRLAAVWLWPTYSLTEWSVTEAELEEFTERLREQQRLLSGLVQLQDGGALRLETWPIAEDPITCRGCTFRGSCEGARRLEYRQGAASLDEPFSGC